MQFENVLVHKPWGKEYLLYENGKVAIWHLIINPGQGTSLHAHPNKKTGLLLVKGEAEVSFLNDSFIYRPPQKTMIRQGVFHQTRAFEGGLELIEIETPINKEDIVRLKDSYGRKGKPYEGPECCEPFFDRPALSFMPTMIGNCAMCFCQVYTREEALELQNEQFIVCSGSIHAGGIDVLSAGDIVNKVSLHRLAGEFEVDNLLLITVDYKWIG